MSFLLLLAPVKIEQGRFNIIKDGSRIGTEEFSVSMRGSQYVVDGRLTMGDVVISSKLEVDAKLIPVSYEVSSAAGKLRVNVVKPISELQTVVGGETSSADFRFPDGGVILDNNLFHHYLILLYRVHAGEKEFPVFVPQDQSIGSAKVRSTGPRAYELEIGDVRVQATTDADGRLLKLTVPAANVVVERCLLSRRSIPAGFIVPDSRPAQKTRRK
jgi:hypothetical protein